MSQFFRDNHYVPKLYLKQWAHNGKVSTYRLLVPNNNYPLWKEHSMKGIAFRRNLYTYIGDEGETDEFERWLDRMFESPAEEAIERAVNEQRLSPLNWQQLIRFLAAQDVRTPARLREIVARQSKTLEPLLTETLTNSIEELEKGAHKSPSWKAEDHSRDLFPFKVTVTPVPDGDGTIQAEAIIGRRMWLAVCRHILTSTISHLLAHRWTILHCPSGMSWPTSDNPVVRLNFTDLNNYDFGGGWGRKNGEIFLPLSPKHLLYTKIGSRPPPRGTILDEATASIFRRMLIEHADRYIFAVEKREIHLIRPRTVCT